MDSVLSKDVARMRGYRPPAADEEGLTAHQVAERQESRRRAVLANLRAEITHELAGRIIRSNVAELAQCMGIEYDVAKEVMEAAVAFRREYRVWREKRQ